MDKQIPPVRLPTRAVPVALEKDLKNELDALTRDGIIAPVNCPTDWVSAFVAVRKPNGKIRLCIDPKPLNKALKRNHYPLPTIDDLNPMLAGGKVFTVCDAKNGYWHVELDEKKQLHYHLWHALGKISLAAASIRRLCGF